MIESLESRIAPATFLVTSLADEGSGSLRLAIVNANGNPGPDVILFEKSLAGSINVTAGAMFISGELTIKGPGAAKVILDAHDRSQIFIVNDASNSQDSPLTVSGLSFFNGKAPIPAPNQVTPGGAIQSQESLKIKGCAFIDNEATGSGGAILLAQGETTVPLTADIRGTSFSLNTSGGSGGGALSITANGGVTLKNNSFTGNFASGVGSGVQVNAGPRGDVLVERCQFLGNSAFVAGGGGSLIGNTITVRDCVFHANDTQGSAGGLEVVGSKLIFERSVFIQNEAEDQAAGLDVAGVADSLVIRSCNFVANTCFPNVGGDGGGLRIAGADSVARIIASTISDNVAGRGGGIFVVPGTGLLEIIGSRITGNRASGDGGGVMVDENVMTGEGSDLKIARSKITGNVAEANNGGGVAFFGDGEFTLLSSQVTQNRALISGGGLALFALGQSTIVGSLIAQNSAIDGGGLFAEGPLEIRLAKILNNTATELGGGMLANNRLVLTATIVSGNMAETGGGLFVELQPTLNGSKVIGNISADGVQIVVD